MTQLPNRDVVFEIVVADITTLDVDAIVNAANQMLWAGGGVCGAIHAAAGYELEQECQRIAPMGIPVGSVVTTPGFNLKAKHVIHAVAPKFFETGFEGLHLLRSAYQSAIFEADQAGAKTVAIPSLGTGIYGWDVHLVAPYVIDAILETLPELGNLETVYLCCFTDQDASIYQSAWNSKA